MAGAEELIAKKHVLTTPGHLAEARKFVLAKVDAIELMFGISDSTLDRLYGQYKGFVPRFREGAEVGLEKLILFEAWLDAQIGRQMAEARARGEGEKRGEASRRKGSPDAVASD